MSFGDVVDWQIRMDGQDQRQDGRNGDVGEILQQIVAHGFDRRNRPAIGATDDR